MRYSFQVERALIGLDPTGPVVLAKSPGLSPSVEESLVDLTNRAGLDGGAAPALFAHPCGRRHVAVGRAAGRRVDALVWDRRTYRELGDPFQLSDAFPPAFAAADFETLTWPPEPLPARTAAGVAALLATNDGPLLLGGTQALLDGSRLLFAPSADGEAVFRAVWQLLPGRSRGELWPSTRTTNPGLTFHAAASPGVPNDWPAGALAADQARDYPEGRYELALQAAAEAGDQAELDRLFARRSSADTLQLAVGLVVFALLASAATRLVG